MTKKKYVTLSEGLPQVAARLETSNAGTDFGAGIPDLPDLTEVEKASKEREATEKAAEKLREYITKIPGVMDQIAERIWTCLSGDEVHRRSRADEFGKLAQIVRGEILNEKKDELARKTASAGYCEALIRHCPAESWALTALLYGPAINRGGEAVLGLIDLGATEFVPDEDKPFPRDAVQIRGKTYNIPGENATVLADVIGQKVREAFAEAYKSFKERADELFSKSDEGYSLENLVSGRPGKLTVRVPDEAGEDNKGRKFFRPGGIFLLQSDGEVVKILQALGKFQRRMEEIRDLGRELRVSSLARDEFAASRLPGPLCADLKRLHGTIRLSIRSERRHEEELLAREELDKEALAEREDLERETNVSPADWLLNAKRGITLIALRKWTVGGREGDESEETFHNVVFLAERDGEDRIKVFRVPERLSGLFPFPDDSFLEFVHPGEKFSRLPYPLGPILRKAWAIEAAASKRKAVGNGS